MKDIMPVINLITEKNDLEIKTNERIIQLEGELKLTKDCLQVSKKFQRSYNEDLLSKNEEYQSVNNELQEINTHYKYKNKELYDLYNDMTNYLNSTDIGIVFLDENLCVRKFTPSIVKEINLITQDIGRPMHHISNNLINDDLNIGASEVLNSHISSEKEIQSKNGKWYLFKCAPCFTFENSIKGVVLSLVDITNIKLVV
ncbi:PAS domain-containing protein [Clostridium psychrophilum]|uniref:PAS domain-containing protein n=1 Tax=Clostridium psychrophilum TaxID=132926 RepID=UPI001C0B5FCC|nr:PAS domain-containing protein [Clostridium psychrophilum]MBU3183134.1 PAS domain-containing protein [Clostridium psychrophilum]